MVRCSCSLQKFSCHGTNLINGCHRMPQRQASLWSCEYQDCIRFVPVFLLVFTRISSGLYQDCIRFVPGSFDGTMLTKQNDTPAVTMSEISIEWNYFSCTSITLDSAQYAYLYLLHKWAVLCRNSAYCNIEQWCPFKRENVWFPSQIYKNDV